MKTLKATSISPEYAKDMVLRLAANFPGLVDDSEVDGAEVVEWLSNEFYWLVSNFQTQEVSNEKS